MGYKPRNKRKPAQQLKKVKPQPKLKSPRIRALIDANAKAIADARNKLFLANFNKYPLEEAVKEVNNLVLRLKGDRVPTAKNSLQSHCNPPPVTADNMSAPKMEKVSPTTPDTTPSDHSLEEMPKGLIVGLVREIPFTNKEGRLIKDAIVKTVRAKKSACPPEFYKVVQKKGILFATVADQESEDWLMTHRKDISKECGIKFKVYKEEDIPSPHVFKMTFHQSSEESTDDILDTLESYSRQPLPTSKWKLQERTQNGGRAILTMAVDKKSAEYFESRNCRLPFGLGHATMEKVEQLEQEDDKQDEPKKKKCKVEPTENGKDQEYVFPIPTSYPIQQD